MKCVALAGFLFLGAASFGGESPAQPDPRELSPETRAQVRQATEQFRAEQMALYKRLQTARRELEQSAQTPKADEKNIREKAAVIGQIEGDLAVLRAKHYKALRAALPESFATNHAVLGTNLYSSRLNSLVRVPAKTNAP